MARRPTEAHLLMEKVLVEIFGAAHTEAHIEQPDYLEPWQKAKKDGRKRHPWRHDFEVQTEHERLAVEIEGGLWVGGGHVRGKIYQQNLDKYNASAVFGYALLRFSPQDVLNGKAAATLRAWKKART